MTRPRHGADPETPGIDHPGPGGPAGGPPLGRGNLDSTESRFLSSTVAAWGSQLGRTAIRFLADIALARLVLDEFHGLFDYAFAAVVIAGVVRDAGLPYHLVRDEREPYGTVLAWTGGAGLLLAVALAAGSPLFAVFDPRLPAVVAALAPFVLLEGLAVVPRVYFERRLQVGRLVVPELVRGASLAAVAVGLAAAGFGVWAFVAGELVSMAIYGALLWLRVRGRMPLHFDLRRLPGLLRESGFLFAIALTAFTLPYVERFLVGPFVTTAMLAQYGKARVWGLRIQTIVVPAVQRVLYPTLVEVQGDEERSFSVYRIGTVTILAFEALAAWFLFFNAETVLVDILLGEQWREAVPLLRVICFLPLVDPFNRLGGELLKVRREDRLWLLIVVLNFASLVVFGLWLSSRHGALGLAIANFLLLGNLLMTWRVARACGSRFPLLVVDLLYVYLAPLVPFGLVVLLFPEEGWGRFAASLLAGLAGAGLMALRFQRPFRRFFARRDAAAGGGR